MVGASVILARTLAHSSAPASLHTTAPSPVAAAQSRIILVSHTPNGAHTLFDWGGHSVGSLGPDMFGQPFHIVESSPDGSRLVVDSDRGGMVTRVVTDLTGHDFGTLDRRTQFRWAEDDAHLCTLTNPVPNVGQRSVLGVSDLGHTQRTLGVIAEGTDNTGTSFHEVAACSVAQDRVVVLDKTMVTANGSYTVATVSVRVFTLSHFALVKQYSPADASSDVIVSADAAYMIEESVAAPYRSRIVRIADGHILTTLENRIGISFSGDDSEIVASSPPPDRSVIEIIDTENGKVLATLHGTLRQLVVRPGAGDLFVVVGIGVIGPDPLTDANIDIVKPGGSTMQLSTG